MKRVLALLGAAAMVLAAVWIRGAVDSNDDSGSTSPDSADGSLTLVCGPELLAACNGLAESDGDLSVVNEPEADTAARISDGSLVLDAGTAWLAAGPWPGIAAAADRDFPEPTGSEVLAHSPAVIVARTDRLEVLNAACGSANWSCIGDAAAGTWADIGGEASWGRIEVGLPDPDAGDGTVAVNQAVASRVGTSDFATNDLDSPDVEGWFESLAQQSKDNSTSITPLTQFLRVPGSLGVVGALEAEAVTQLESAAVADQLSTAIPEPTAMAEVRLWAADDSDLAAWLDRLGQDRMIGTLTADGWRGGSPDSTGLPEAGVISAVNTRWEQA